jgi:integrase
MIALNNPEQIFAPAPKGGLLIAEAVRLYLLGPVPKMDISDQMKNKYAMKTVITLFGDMPAESLRILQIEELTKKWSTTRKRNRCYKDKKREGPFFSRQYVAKLLGCVRQCWRWLALYDHVTADCAEKITLAVRAAKKIAMQAVSPTIPVSSSDLQRTLVLLPQKYADMVRVQLSSGMRTGELLAMQADQIDRTNEVWSYEPPRHKNSWRGHVRKIYFGSLAQTILKPYLIDQGKIWGCTLNAYYLALRKAQRKARVNPWRPYQLRHAAATQIRKNHGDEATRSLLGHAGDELLKIYAGTVEPKKAG